jgi:hypothetical protein
MTTDDFADASLPVFAGVVARGGLVFKVGPAARVEAGRAAPALRRASGATDDQQEPPSPRRALLLPRASGGRGRQSAVQTADPKARLQLASSAATR